MKLHMPFKSLALLTTVVILSASTVYAAENTELQDAGAFVYSKGDESCEIESGKFTKDNDHYYGNAVFYDYYGDYELQGNKLSALNDLDKDDAIQKLKDAGAYAEDDWKDQSASQWNLAVNEYFKDQDIEPLYFGGARYFNNGNGKNLLNNLYKYSWRRTCGNWFSGALPKEIKSNASDAFFPNQGIVANELQDGNLYLKTTDGSGKILAPYFDKSFVRGDGSQAHGQVYENVEFPFAWDKATSTWLYDSTSMGAQLKQDGGQYFIDHSGEPVKYNGADYFFPFNQAGLNVEAGQAYQLDYMFGMKMELPFNLSADRKVEINGESEDTVFRFAGDDDIWVFIDGKLVLDMGGSHGIVAGAIDFTNNTYMVSGTWNGQEGSPAAAMSNTEFWDKTANGISQEFINENGPYCTTGSLTEALGSELTTGESHTIQIFYMERGWDQSNLKISFNFNQNSQLKITKTTDTSAMNQDIFGSVAESINAAIKEIEFPFSIKNQKTLGDDGVTQIREALQPANGKRYVHRTSDENQTKDLPETGILTLKNGESATFVDQFPYDSYLQVTEEMPDDRFSPVWSLTETDYRGNNHIVTMKQADILEKNDTPLQNIEGTTPYDGREFSDVTREPAEEKSLLLHPYNDSSERVNLQMDITNCLNVGSLTLYKKLADGQLPEDQEFTFLVQFDHIAGTEVSMPDAVEVSLNKANGYEKELTGIPYGTSYTVYEICQDGWTLDSTEPASKEAASDQIDGRQIYNKCVQGKIGAENKTASVTIFNKTEDPEKPEQPTQPEEPTPDKPTQPEKPNPDKPTQPEQPDSPKPSDKPSKHHKHSTSSDTENTPATVSVTQDENVTQLTSAATGDDNLMWVYMMIGGLAFGGILFGSRGTAGTKHKNM